MANKYNGEVSLQIGEKKGLLVYDYAAIVKIEDSLPKGIMDDLTNANMTDIVSIAVIGLQKLTPDISNKDIMEASPPRTILIDTILKAWMYANHGVEVTNELLKKIEGLKTNEEIVDMLEKQADVVTKKKT